MIVSNLSGRIRVRSNHLKSKELSERVRLGVAAMAGVVDVRSNPAAGSLLVLFDGAEIDAQRLEGFLERLCLPAKASTGVRRSAKFPRRLNRAAKVGMVATLGTSLAYGFLGNKKAHIGFGAAFVALAGVHMWRHNGTLLR